MFEGKRTCALLLMAGEGRRFKGATPKQFLPLGEKLVYQYAWETFLKVGFFDEILLICPSDWAAQVSNEIQSKGRVVEGGKTRQESSFKGLNSFSSKPDIVVIHDGVRPFVSEEIILQNVKGAILHGAVDTCIGSADTLVYAPDGKKIDEIPNRAHFLRGQTPQSFRFDWIVKAHELAIKNGMQATDDARLVLNAGYPLFVVNGEEKNFKITTTFDLFLAEQVLNQTTNSMSS